MTTLLISMGASVIKIIPRRTHELKRELPKAFDSSMNNAKHQRTIITTTNTQPQQLQTHNPTNHQLAPW